MLGMSDLFVGVVVVAVIGNAAEHYSAVRMAAQDEMDTALAIAVGSSTQIALFITPVLSLPELSDRADTDEPVSSARLKSWRSGWRC